VPATQTCVDILRNPRRFPVRSICVRFGGRQTPLLQIVITKVVTSFRHNP